MMCKKPSLIELNLSLLLLSMNLVLLFVSFLFIFVSFLFSFGFKRKSAIIGVEENENE